MPSRRGKRIPLPADDLVEQLLRRRSAPLELLRRIDEIEDAVASLALSLSGSARRILNIGCAGGSLAVKLALGSGEAIVHAVDDSPALLRLAAQLVGEWKVEFRVLLNMAAPASVPLPDAMFDLVVGHNVLCRSRDPEKVLSEAVRLTAPSGAVLIVEPRRPGPMTSWIRRRIHWNRASDRDFLANTFHASGFSMRELLEHAAGVAGCGLGVRRDSRLGIVLARPR